MRVLVTGGDEIPLPYYRHKLAVEQAVAESGVGFSILRAAQFHYFIDTAPPTGLLPSLLGPDAMTVGQAPRA